MDENSVELMRGLATAMEQMQHDPQGLAGWLLSNYRLEKVGDGEPTGFHRVKSKASGASADGAEYPEEKVEKLNEFFKRANAPMSVVGAKKRDLLKKNKKAQTEEGEEIEEQEEAGDEPEEEGDEGQVIEAKKKFIDPKYANVNSSDILSEEEVEAIARKAAAAKKLQKRAAATQKEHAAPVAMPEEYADLPDETNSPVLRAHNEKQLQKIVEARKNVTSGVRTNPNGFSRGG